jgi:hypothetical protein
MNLINYLYKVTLGGGKESSKRFIAVFIVLAPMNYIIFRFTNLGNMPTVLGILVGFVLSLLTVASYENVKGVGKTKEKPIDDDQQS